MQIETQRLILREYTMDDFDDLYEIMSDPETKAGLHIHQQCLEQVPGK